MHEFANAFTRGNKCDVELNDLILGVKCYADWLASGTRSAMEIFQFVREADCYHNISIAYRILFTMPVIVASAERSF